MGNHHSVDLGCQCLQCLQLTSGKIFNRNREVRDHTAKMLFFVQKTPNPLQSACTAVTDLQEKALPRVKRGAFYRSIVAARPPHLPQESLAIKAHISLAVRTRTLRWKLRDLFLAPFCE